MKTIKQIREYISDEKRIASTAKESPEYQVFVALQGLADTCTTTEEFLKKAQAIELQGAEAEVREAHEWLKIALDVIISE